MYEMYPDTWAHAAERARTSDERPRRRARKPHSVVPEVLVLHETVAKAADPS
ncbi:MAG TPA: hypothetical protein VIT20_06200 [Propionibacteriaceae bacterium]